MPILDTVVLFAAADSNDRFHEGGRRYLRELSKGMFMGTFAVIEFDLILRSNGYSPQARASEMVLLLADYPARSSVHPISPPTLVLGALIERESGLGYFDSMLAAEALQLDGTIVSSDREFDKVNGLKRIKLE